MSVRRFEYRVLTIAITKVEEYDTIDGGFGSETVLDTEGFEKQLNDYTASGFRLVSVQRVHIEDAKGYRVCVFERPVKHPRPPGARVTQPEPGTIEKL